MEGSSILDTLGTDLLSILTPVSLCMLLVVLLISSLSPPHSLSSLSSPPQIITAANLIYSEDPSDTPFQKLEGALLNAVVFVLIIALVTFLLVLLYYYNFTNFLKNYMRLSTFFILTTMGGAIFLSLIKHFSLPLDAPSCFLSLFNFAILGVVSVFGGKGVPILVTQCYTVILGIITAAWFTQLPEWTTWVLLVALAVYDLVAVLAPGGPLKILVELAQSRDDDLPALVYEARPTVSGSNGGRRRGGLAALVGGVSDNRSIELQSLERDCGQGLDSGGPAFSGSNERRRGALEVVVDGVSDNRSIELQSLGKIGGQGLNFNAIGEIGHDSGENEGEALGSVSEIQERGGDDNGEERRPLIEFLGGEEEGELEESTRGIKLGLGDFVFYSVLVGRAAMYDLMTVYACYLAIISGLSCTLILLSVCRRALPALPISITLGVIFYFLTRLLMEPFVVQTSSNLLMF